MKRPSYKALYQEALGKIASYERLCPEVIDKYKVSQDFIKEITSQIFTREINENMGKAFMLGNITDQRLYVWGTHTVQSERIEPGGKA